MHCNNTYFCLDLNSKYCHLCFMYECYLIGKTYMYMYGCREMAVSLQVSKVLMFYNLRIDSESAFKVPPWWIKNISTKKIGVWQVLVKIHLLWILLMNSTKPATSFWTTFFPKKQVRLFPNSNSLKKIARNCITHLIMRQTLHFQPRMISIKLLCSLRSLDLGMFLGERPNILHLTICVFLQAFE